MTDLLKVTVDGKETEVPRGSTIMDAARSLDIEIPHFCYHPRLSIAGNCRMCLVEVEGAPKPVASCAWPAAEGMVINTQSELSKEARQGTMELLLINHPLDCPICDQAGECTLQDLSVSYGSDQTRYTEMKRAVKDRDIGAKIKTVMTRCIHCTRCVRFATEVAGVEEFGATFRGENTTIGTYVEHALQSELSGNMIDLCPVGALTNKPYAFTARPWELTRTNTIDVMHADGANIKIESRFGKVMRVTPNTNDAINEEWIADTTRYMWDALSTNRLESPMVAGKTTSWPKAFDAVKRAIKGVKKDKIAALAGEIHSAEDMFAFNAFMKDVVGTQNVDSRAAGSILNADKPAHTHMNTSIEDLEQADVILLVGTNPRLEAPMVNLRLRKAVQSGATVAVIGADEDLTYETTYLGDNPEILREIAEGKHKFSKVLKKADNPAVIVGEKSALRRNDAGAIMKRVGEIVDTYKMVTEEWNGFNVLHQQVGTLAGLAANCVPGKDGMDTSATIKALEAGNVDVLFMYGEVDMPAEALKKAKKVIYLGTHKTTVATNANVSMPVTTFAEKNAWWINVEGRVQEGQQSVAAPMHVKEDWKVFRALSAELGKVLPFDSLNDLRELMIEKNKVFSNIGAIYKRKWSKLTGTGRLTKKAFVKPVEQFYLNNEILRQSDVMRECQNENTAAKNNLLRKAG